MAKLSSEFASISPGMESQEAQEGLVSILKAWNEGLDTDNVEQEVMDKINVLGRYICPTLQKCIDIKSSYIG